MPIKKYNPYLTQAEIFSQAPATNWLGVLAQALGGYYRGKGGRYQQEMEAEEEKKRGELLSRVLAGGTMPQEQPQGPQAPYYLANPQAKMQPQPQPKPQAQPAYLSPEFLQDPQNVNLAIALMNQEQKRGQTDIARQQAEADYMRRMELEREKMRSAERIAGMRTQGAKISQTEKLSPYEAARQRTLGAETGKKEVGLTEAVKDLVIMNDHFNIIEENLPTAQLGPGSDAIQWITRAAGTNQQAREAKAAIDKELRMMTAVLLKPTFGGQISNEERKFIQTAQGKTSFSAGEIKKLIELGKRVQETLVRAKTEQVSTLKGLSPQGTIQPQTTGQDKKSALKSAYGIRE